MDNASILSRRDMRPLPKPTRKEVSPAPGTEAGKPILNRCAGLLGNFELNRPTCFLLNHRRSVSHPAADTNVIGLQHRSATGEHRGKGIITPQFNCRDLRFWRPLERFRGTQFDGTNCRVKSTHRAEL